MAAELPPFTQYRPIPAPPHVALEPETTYLAPVYFFGNKATDLEVWDIYATHTELRSIDGILGMSYPYPYGMLTIEAHTSIALVRKSIDAWVRKTPGVTPLTTPQTYYKPLRGRSIGILYEYVEFTSPPNDFKY